MLLGVAWYPEHWPVERWETDAKLMRDAGITRVRVGEFAWHKFEPRPGQFEFAWLREAIDVMARHGVKTIMCTPTPTYPAWLHKMYPDIHQIDSAGKVREFGMRQDACKNHPGYRDHAARIVAEVVREFGEHPDVVAWQIDNELGCHGSARCWCPHCDEAFRAWLRERFKGDIAALNAAWGTSFWSQDYNDFDEISVPRDNAGQDGNGGQNPGLVLDFYRFSSEAQSQFLREQAQAIRKGSPGRIVTHNFMGAYPHMDYFDMAREVDIASWDNYPFAANGTNQPPPSLHHDIIRGLKQKNVWVMEQASGQGGWGHFVATPQPGQMRLWAWQAVARGADMISFFRWRSCRWGREQYWHGLLYHHGIPQRRYDEAKQLGGEFRALSSELDGTNVVSDVGIVYDYSSHWALEAQPNAESGFGYRQMATLYSTALNRMGVTSDVIALQSDLGRYKVIIAPTLHVCSPETAQRLKEFVAAGGTLLLGPRSGVKDAENAVVDALLPGALRELAGGYVEDYDAFGNVPGLEMRVKDESGALWPASAIADVLVPEGGSRVRMTYAAHYYAGRPAVLENALGAGRCLYVGTVLDDAGLRALLAGVLNGAGVAVRKDMPDALEIVRRAAKGRALTFYLNHHKDPLAVDVATGMDLLTMQRVSGKAVIPGFGVLVVKAG